MMPDCGRHIWSVAKTGLIARHADAAGIILTSLAINRRLAAHHDSSNPALTRLICCVMPSSGITSPFHPECSAIYAALD
ncbi:hypothetical protein [Klebsiella pneumoniae]|uniref:hypothetical protein n=1 Tax=Klebsiella pneumoniae TaxID=573 RepID=UPI00388DC8D2